MPYWLNLPFNIKEGWENCSHGPRLEWSDPFLFPLLFFHPLKFICKNSFQLSQVIIKKTWKRSTKPWIKSTIKTKVKSL